MDIIKLLRPAQWLKNGFVFLPLFFGGMLLSIDSWYSALIAFFAFSMAASSVYCLNDIKDVEADCKHPQKRFRPIAAGSVSVTAGIILMVILAALSILLPFIGFNCELGSKVSAVIGLYIVLNVAYCLKLKHYALVDVIIIAIGFVLRVIAGGIACDIWLSPWIVLMSFLLALFLAFAKRRDDVIMREKTGVVTRSNTLRYNLEFLNQTLGLLASITIVCYIIYTVQPDVEMRMSSRYVYVSSLFVIAGILRYLQSAIVDARTGSPTKIVMHDRFLQCCIAGWILTFIFILYL